MCAAVKASAQGGHLHWNRPYAVLFGNRDSGDKFPVLHFSFPEVLLSLILIVSVRVAFHQWSVPSETSGLSHIK